MSRPVPTPCPECGYALTRESHPLPDHPDMWSIDGERVLFCPECDCDLEISETLDEQRRRTL